MKIINYRFDRLVRLGEPVGGQKRQGLTEIVENVYFKNLIKDNNELWWLPNVKVQ